MAEKSPANSAASGRIERVTPKQRFINALELEASVEERGESVFDVVYNGMESAETIDDVFDAQDVSLPAAKDMIDRELEIRSFVVREGDDQYEANSIGYYFIIDAADADTGEEVRFQTGASNVLALLWTLRLRDELPQRVRITGKATSNGTLLMLKRVGPRTVRS